MKYYKVSMDMTGTKDVILHCNDDYGISQNSLIVGRYFYNWDERFKFYYNAEEGEIWTDYIANDKGWFVVSDRLKSILERVNTSIQFIDVNVYDVNNNKIDRKYYIANILKIVDALCLEKSRYFETDVKGIGKIYIISKYGIYEKKTEDADVFKLNNHQQVPIFVSEKFKDITEKEKITGISFMEIAVA